MIRVPKLEMHVADACNLRCDGCSHYSNFGISGVIRFAEGAEWLRNWAQRINPVHFSFLGGEPLLNRELPRFLSLARDLWPHTDLLLVTNGLLLERWTDELWESLRCNGFRLAVSRHSNEQGYRIKFDRMLTGIRRKAEHYGVPLEERNSITNWYRAYRIESSAQITPFQDNDQQSSWSACQHKHCVTLRGNTLWKCPPIAHLTTISSRLQTGAAQPWASALSYVPLTLTASDDEIREFLRGALESICGLCPAKPVFIQKSIH